MCILCYNDYEELEKIELSYCQGNIHRSQKRDSKSRGVDR